MIDEAREPECRIDPVTLRAVACDPIAMRHHAERLADVARRATDRREAASAASRAGIAFATIGEVDRAERLLQDAIATWREVDDDAGLATARIRLAQVHQIAGRTADALALLDEVTRRCRVVPALHRLLDFALQHRGKLLSDSGRHGDALVCLHEALVLREAKADALLSDSTRQAIEVVTERLATG